MHTDTKIAIVWLIGALIVWIAVAEHWRRERRRAGIDAAKRRHPSARPLAPRPDAADQALERYKRRARELGQTPQWTHDDGA